MCIGSLYAWSVFAVPMAERLRVLTGVEVGSLAIVFTVANAVGPIPMIGGGAVNDRLGPRNVVLLGGVLFGLGMVASGLAPNIAVLIVGYGLGVGLGMGMVYGAVVSNAVKLFPDRRGFVGGVTTASYGISSVIVPVVARWLISTWNVSMAFIVLGCVMTAVICAAAQCIVVPLSEAPDSKDVQEACDGLSWKEMLRAPEFPWMLLMLLCGAFSGLAIISQASQMAMLSGFDAGTAALMVSALALFNTAGRLLAGIAVDRLGYVSTLRMVFFTMALAMALLALGMEAGGGVLALGLMVCGLSFGSVMGAYPGFTAAQFGPKNNSVNYGIMFVGFAFAGVLGPIVASTCLDAFGSYSGLFATAFALSCVGMVASLCFVRIARA